MIYTDREVRLFRGIVVAISISTLAVAALTYVQTSPSCKAPGCDLMTLQIEVLAGIVLAALVYGVGEWLLPVPLGPPRTPTPRPAPPRMRPWQRDRAGRPTRRASGKRN